MRRGAALAVVVLLVLGSSAAPAGAQWPSVAAGAGAARAVPDLLAPASLDATCESPLLGSPRVHLTWPASATPGVTQYEVRYGVNLGSLGAPIVVHGTSYTTGTLGIGLPWYFQVRTAAGSWRSPAVQDTATVISILFVGVACG